ncbi:MAG TPA: glycoside hydrolase family 92 protein, partial [Phycisphaerae bacterium]|nr:glycoside hydrolase family 92 protein [Phycisphaerae bacterium]
MKFTITKPNHYLKQTISIAIIVLLATVIDVMAAPDVTHLVNTFVGTAAGGNDFPGADMPSGMVQWSPDTTTGPGGYRWRDTVISRGFSFTHFSGRGCSAYQDFPFMPTIGSLFASPATNATVYGSSFLHANEFASPGYYSVRLDPSGIQAELTV